MYLPYCLTRAPNTPLCFFCLHWENCQRGELHQVLSVDQTSAYKVPSSPGLTPTLPGSQSHSCPVLPHAISFSFHAAFKIFSPTLVYNTLIVTCIGIFCAFIFFGGQCNSWICGFTLKKKNSGKCLAFSKNKERNKPVISKIFLHALLWNRVPAHVVLTL